MHGISTQQMMRAQSPLRHVNLLLIVLLAGLLIGRTLA